MKCLERWKPLIEAARDSQQVLEVVRDFLALWTVEEIAELPVTCRVTHVHSEQDLAAWATTLALEAPDAAPRGGRRGLSGHPSRAG